MNTQPPYKITIEECIEAWVDTYSTQKSRTEHEHTIKQFQEWLQEAGGYNLDAPASIIRETAYRWVLNLQHPEKHPDGRPKEGHIQDRWSTLSSFYTVAVQNGIVSENPIDLADRHRHYRK